MRPEHAETRFAQTVRALDTGRIGDARRGTKGVKPQTIKDPFFGGLTEIDDPLRERSPEKKPFVGKTLISSLGFSFEIKAKPRINPQAYLSMSRI